MKFSLIAAAAAFATSAFAAPTKSTPTSVDNFWPPSGFGHGNNCLKHYEAEALLASFIDAFQLAQGVPAANATLQTILADNFQEVSDSILSLEDLPLGTPSQTQKQVYINGLLNQTPPSSIQTLLGARVACNNIIWQWIFQGVGGPGKEEVKGFNLFSVNAESKQIETLYVEFNSIAWAVDTGYTITYPFPTPS